MFPPNASDPIKSRRLNCFFTTLNKDLKKKKKPYFTTIRFMRPTSFRFTIILWALINSMGEMVGKGHFGSKGVNGVFEP